jgi:hypothetical protein
MAEAAVEAAAAAVVVVVVYARLNGAAAICCRPRAWRDRMNGEARGARLARSRSIFGIRTDAIV